MVWGVSDGVGGGAKWGGWGAERGRGAPNWVGGALGGTPNRVGGAANWVRGGAKLGWGGAEWSGGGAKMEWGGRQNEVWGGAKRKIFDLHPPPRS